MHACYLEDLYCYHNRLKCIPVCLHKQLIKPNRATLNLLSYSLREIFSTQRKFTDEHEENFGLKACGCRFQIISQKRFGNEFFWSYCGSRTRLTPIVLYQWSLSGLQYDYSPTGIVVCRCEMHLFRKYKKSDRR